LTYFAIMSKSSMSRSSFLHILLNIEGVSDVSDDPKSPSSLSGGWGAPSQDLSWDSFDVMRKSDVVIPIQVHKD
jgi:hypothetical protein